MPGSRPFGNAAPVRPGHNPGTRRFYPGGWLLPPRGRSLVYGGKWTSLTVQDGPAGESTRPEYEDYAGRMWIGSECDGISVGIPGSWTIVTEKDGLAGYEVRAMTQDRDGTYWLGTNSGLSRGKRTALPAPVTGKNFR